MTPVCSLSDRFRGRCWRFARLGLALALAAIPRTALAQAAPATEPPAPASDAAPVPALAPSAPAEPTPAPAAPTAPPVPPADASTVDDGDDEQQPRSKHPGHKQHKQRKHVLAFDGDAAEPDASAGKRGEPNTEKPNKHDVQLKGRLFALGELSHRHETVVGSSGALVTRDRDALDLSLASARFGVEYHSPLRFLSAQLELEVAGKPRVKDAFIEAGKRFFVKAGQFKVPSAALELASPWTLPLAHRGLVHDLMTDWMDIAGRAPGVAVGYRGRGAFKPKLTLGAFQGTTLKQVAPGDRDVKLIDHASLKAQTFAARGEVTLASVTVGGWYEQRVGSTAVGAFDHFATFGLDAELSQRFEHGALRVWVDGSAGESLYVNADKPGTDPSPWFAAGRALVAYRFGGLALGDPYVEPFGFFAVLDPDTEVVKDFVSEAALGVAAGFWDRARLSLQGEMTNGQRNFPTSFLDNQNPDHLSLLLQAGARF